MGMVQIHKHPVGGKTAPAVVSVWKKCRLHQSEAIDLFQNKWLKPPGNFHWVFDQLRQFTGSLLCQTRAVFSSFHMAMRFCKESDQWSPKGFLLWSSSNTTARHWCFASALGSLGCWLWSEDYMEWLILTAATLHRPHLCVLELSYFYFFLIQNTSFQEWMDVPCASISPGHWQKNITKHIYK